jgi:diadenosine tetraphosphate (Ap4A) HIT family hydrolase
MTDEAQVAEACSICQFMQGLDPGAILWEDDYWVCASFMQVPGWTMVMTKRHAEGIWGLNDEEAVRFGPLIREIAAVVKDAIGAERIHYAAMGEVALHYHNVILPRLPGQKPVWDSMALVDRAHTDAEPEAAEDMKNVLSRRLKTLEPGNFAK